MDKFIQITGVGNKLYALDENGLVWKYNPATEDRYAFWGKITNHRAGESS